MSKQWWDETSAEFAQNFAEVSTGIHQAHEPEVRIEHIEGGCYRLSVDKAEIVLTSQDLMDICSWCLRYMRTLESQAAEAQEHKDTQHSLEHHYTGGE